MPIVPRILSKIGLALGLSILFFAHNSFAQTVCQPDDLCARSCNLASLNDVRHSRYRGWDYLVAKLRRDGIDDAQIWAYYEDPRMPPFGEIPFRIKPIETAQMYSQFTSKPRLNAARKFLAEYPTTFAQAEKKYRVSRYIIAAILLIETHFGENTGSELVLNRLSRVASVGEPCNMIVNFRRLRAQNSSVKFSDVVARAKYLEQIFYPEIPALLEITRRYNVDLLKLKGSVSGAFGMPQFLPSTFLRFAVDGNKDGRVMLTDPQDAIHSTANFLAHLGWKEGGDTDQRRNALWRYNHSYAYVDAALRVANALRH